MDEYLRLRSTKVLPLVLKADVAGSLEALLFVLDSLQAAGIELTVVSTGLGPITEGDVKTAAACGALVLGFNVTAGRRAEAAARQCGITIESRRVIYELTDGVRRRMADLLDPVFEERPLGTLHVRRLFGVRGVGTVAGGRVTEGIVRRGSRVRVLRAGAVVFEGELASLRVHKDDVASVAIGHECGVTVAGFDAFAEGDRIEAFELQLVAPKLAQ